MSYVCVCFFQFQIRAHCIAFRNGMSDLINLEWLRMFDQHELQVLISGAAIPIDIEDLKQYTNYSGGYTADHVVIKMLWKIVEHFTDQQKRQLLKFITSCSRPPLLGFKVGTNRSSVRSGYKTFFYFTCKYNTMTNWIKRNHF